MERAAATLPPYPGGFDGQGVVIAGGGKYFPSVWVCVRMLRDLGCELPVELWHLGPDELSDEMRRIVEPWGVTCVDVFEVRRSRPARSVRGWEVKAYAAAYSRFHDVLLLDADNVPVLDPSFLFSCPQYRKCGALFWPDGRTLEQDNPIWRLTGVPYRDEPAFESGQLLVDKGRCWRPLLLALWMNEHSDFWYRHIYGDKDTFHLAWRKLEMEYAMPSRGIKVIPHTLCQHDFDGRRLFQHRVGDKWAADGRNERVPGFVHQERCWQFQDELHRLWFGRPNRPHRHESADPCTRSLAEALCGRRWVYVREGQPPRPMTFALDGTIIEGRAIFERGWHLRVHPFDRMLGISGVRGLACLLLHENGRWVGRWRTDPETKVELLPQEQVASSEPAEDVTGSSRPCISLLTLYTDEIAHYAAPVADAKEQYCAAHGYTFVRATASLDTSRPPAWSKILLIERYLEDHPECQWVVWIDADAVIMHTETPLEAFLDDRYDLVVGTDDQWVNTGVFFLRNSAAARRFLRQVYSRTEHTHHPFWEQAAMHDLLREGVHGLSVHVVPSAPFNAYPSTYTEGDFILHFAAVPDRGPRVLEALRSRNLETATA